MVIVKAPERWPRSFVFPLCCAFYFWCERQVNKRKTFYPCPGTNGAVRVDQGGVGWCPSFYSYSGMRMFLSSSVKTLIRVPGFITASLPRRNKNSGLINNDNAIVEPTVPVSPLPLEALRRIFWPSTAVVDSTLRPSLPPFPSRPFCSTLATMP